MRRGFRRMVWPEKQFAALQLPQAEAMECGRVFGLRHVIGKTLTLD